jgi:nucleoside-diphosphate kinase
MEVLAVLKPDGVLRRAAGAKILKGLQESGLCEFKSFKQVTVPTNLLDQHYSHVVNKGFYPWLSGYMSGAESYMVLLETADTNLPNLRALLGATRAQTALPNTLRYQYTPYGGLNGMHLSENPEEAVNEIAMWKPALAVNTGDFDMPIADYIAKYEGQTDHSLALRAACVAIAHHGEPVDAAYQSHVRALLLEELEPDDSDKLDYLTNAVVVGCVV